MNKRGTHVEILIAFIIFIVFVLFLLSIILPPVTTQRDKEKMVDSIEVGIIGRVSSDVKMATVNTGTGGDVCIDLSDLGMGRNIAVKDISENAGSISISGNDDSLLIDKTNSADTLFRIYYSDNFDSLSGGGCNADSYDVGLVKTYNYVFENKFLELLNTNYNTLKEQLKIPQGVEIGYGIVLSNGTSIESSSEQVSTNIYVKETPVEYVDLDGDLKEGYVRTKVW